MSAHGAEDAKAVQKLMEDVSDPKELERQLASFAKNCGTAAIAECVEDRCKLNCKARCANC
jgi:hypothetical protein